MWQCLLVRFASPYPPPWPPLGCIVINLSLIANEDIEQRRQRGPGPGRGCRGEVLSVVWLVVRGWDVSCGKIEIV